MLEVGKARSRCHRCREAVGPLTPLTFWAGRPLRVGLCAPCLRRCAGSLLYRLDRKRLDAQTPAGRAAWLASLHPQDREAFEGGGAP